MNNDFSNSLKELKDYLDFNMLFTNNLQKELDTLNFKVILFDAHFINRTTVKIISDIKDKGKILVSNTNKSNTNKSNGILYDEKLRMPFSILDFNKKIINLISKQIFIKNSSLKIKDYTLDKNEKKLKKNKKFIVITEQEIKLIELLFYSKDSVTKKKILESAWQYSSNTDTHTIETHIYRLRNKILKKFNDENFIINTNKGYKI